MPKTHRVDFDDLKARADFRAVLAHYGLTPVGSGDQTKVPCPFHDDGRPSCSVNLEKRLFHCFGCGAKGNVLEFVHRMEALEAANGATVSLRAAGLRLAEICGLPLASGTRHGTRKPSGGPAQPRARDGGPSTTRATAATTPQEPHRASTAEKSASSPIWWPKRRCGPLRRPGDGV
jgi:hypothetical protein